MFIPKRSFYTLFIVCATFLILSVSRIAAQEPVTIQIMTQLSELTPEEIAAFETANPDIHVELIESTDFLMDLAHSTGEMPDLIRAVAGEMPALVKNGYVLDLTDYFKASDIIHLDDIASAANSFKFDDRYYGLPKDWSPDFTLWIYKPSFEAAGIALPDASQPLTYAELADLAEKLTVRDGDTIVQHGILFPSYLHAITQILIQQNTSMFNEDYTELQLTDNPVAMEVVRYFYDNSLKGSFNSDWNEMPQMWTDGSNGFPPIIQWGYWYGGTRPADHPIREQVMMLPAPTWDRSLPRVDMTAGPAGMVISANTEHPDEAYRFFEWYIAGGGGIKRTSNGWGAPPLMSMFDLLPQESEFDKQRFEVLKGELPYSDWQMPIYPGVFNYLNTDRIWQENIKLALAGEIDFDTFVSNLQEEVNLSILNEQMNG